MTTPPEPNIDPTRRFTNRVENYRRYRPGYPSLVIDLIRETCGPSAPLQVVDIGSGTGIFTRKLLEAGFEVSAVEPNEAMRVVAEEDLSGFPHFRSISAPAEVTGLPSHYFNAITAAQAFHWFERGAVRLEFNRILQPGGWCFLIWNERKPKNSAFNHEYQGLLATLGQSFEGVRDRVEADKTSLEDFFLTGSYREAHFDNPHILDWEELRGRFLSSSYVPTEEDPRYGTLLARLEEIFRKHEQDGRVEFEQQTGVYFGRL
jgi:ubiquinone/menaquinone biosynthesis C-methylase UbiE